ncbi:siderophore-interacting protein [Amycolatopsis thailandensis]|uniref:NADPH-dependent ferric siderophore reductase n=1 Tax=Amycolatopsis thailandensis TaxID=589330 RepID=A0A229RE85_9PSEU|nr:siderophore-interacting protein [Amycolatopsis thailandensis]OXM44895.1 NADPH-dependent ferric siderophore reductase [Amycolatopsis thailandensis]
MSYIEAKVTGVRRLTPHMSRVTFSGASLVDQAPDQYLKVFFPQPGQSEPVLPAPLSGDEVYSWYRTYLAMPDDVRPPMRTYTVRALRPSVQEVDIDFVLHGDEGPASAWASGASEGDKVAFLGPHGLYDVPEGTNWQLLIGDETAIPAIGAIVEALPAGTRALVYVEIGDREDRQVFETQGTVELHWVVRGSQPIGEAVLDAVRKAELPGGTAYAWISGEANMVKLARRHLVRERGIDKRAICFTGYWRQGMSEEAAGREAMRQAEAGEAPASDDD